MDIPGLRDKVSDDYRSFTMASIDIKEAGSSTLTASVSAGNARSSTRVGETDNHDRVTRLGKWPPTSNDRSPPVGVGRLVGAGLLAASAGVVPVAAWGAGLVQRAVLPGHPVEALDRAALAWVRGVRTPGLDTLVATFTQLGGPEPQQLALGVVGLTLAWRQRTWLPLTVCGAAYAGADLLTRSGKSMFGRARPPVDAAVPPLPLDASLPSGHALFGVVVAGTIAYLLTRRATSRWVRRLVAGQPWRGRSRWACRASTSVTTG